MNPAEEIAALRAELESLRTENKMMRLAGVISKQHSIRETAIEDVMTRVRNAFVVEEGKMVPIDPSRGETVEEFVTKLRVTAPHLFQPSSGTGSRGAARGGSVNIGGGSANDEPNPFLKATFNLTRQAQLVRTNPQLAQILRAQAGG